MVILASEPSCAVAVIILHWKCPTDTLRCLHSVFASDYESYQVIVVDNGSEDGSLALIQERYPNATILENGENLGYAGGNNVGIGYALEQGVDYVLLLNDDVVIERSTLFELVKAALDCPDAGFVGPKVCMLKEPERILSAGIVMNGLQSIHRGLGEVDLDQYSQPSQVDALSGCALLVSRAVIEAVGMLDETFFAYHEDIEWCYRGRKAGFKVLFAPRAKAFHPDTRQRDVDSPFVTYYTSRNRLLFAIKHRLGIGMIIRVLAGYLRTLASWSLRPRWRHKRDQRNALVQAILDFALGRFGKAGGFS